MMLSKSGEDAYFAASNSRDGFCSYYPQCFDHPRVKRLFAVKGGPGTGKSRFLREVAGCARLHGRTAEYIYCSSDPNSLDGVILTSETDCVALLDATAPHVYEPTRPGVREELIDLGEFWDSERLALYADEIEALNQAKSAAYRRAYRYLSGVGEMDRLLDGLVAPAVRREALRALAEKLLRDIPEGEGYSVRPALIRAVGMEGAVGLDTYFRQAKRRVKVEELHGTSQFLMQELGELAVKRGLAIRISHDPISPDRVDGIFFCESGLAVAVGKRGELSGADKTVPMRRLLDPMVLRRVRAQVRYAEGLREGLLGGAIDELARVKEHHFALEGIYTAAMDFSAKEEFTKKFCIRLFGLQNS